MTHQAIDLQGIDFRQPDGTFDYKGQTYHIKQYLERYFFKSALHNSLDLLYSFIDGYYGKYICEKGELPETIDMFTGSLVDSVQRCVQYKEIIFCFSFGDYSCGELLVGDVIYFSSKYGYWMSFDRETVEEQSYDNFLDRPNEFFINEARKAYEGDRLQPISLQAIDFSQPDGEVFFRGQSYQVNLF
jgi:hypothetical protein